MCSTRRGQLLQQATNETNLEERPFKTLGNDATDSEKLFQPRFDQLPIRRYPSLEKPRTSFGKALGGWQIIAKRFALGQGWVMLLANRDQGNRENSYRTGPTIAPAELEKFSVSLSGLNLDLNKVVLGKRGSQLWVRGAVFSPKRKGLPSGDDRPVVSFRSGYFLRKIHGHEELSIGFGFGQAGS